MKTWSIDKINRNLIGEDVPNLGSIITLDNKGRLINSQFSKPSSSQTLLKLNSCEEVPDADDLPYAIISYGDTPNIINLPYNDHNYVCIQNTKKYENYDKKALDYISKQSNQSTTKNSFTPTSSVRISHFGSYNCGASQSDSVFFSEKFKSSQQFTFNQQISHTSTPHLTNKTISTLPLNNNSSIYSANKLRPGAIVINSGSVNTLKSMNVIQLRRPSLDTGNISETRIFNLPMKKPSVLTNIIGNNQTNHGDNSKIDVAKSINLVPRCVCGFTHDDGGMIRCEICRTWQHIVCMYPDNKFPIYYKCDRCEPREVDVKRAVSTQTSILIKTGYSPSNFLAHQRYNDYDFDNDLENNFSKPNGSHIVIVQPDIKSGYRSMAESMSTTSLPIYISASKDPQSVPPGSPRTSKRKQDLISLKSVLSKPTGNSVIINNKLDVQKQLLVDNQSRYNCMTGFLVPTSTHKLQLDLTNEPYTINEMSSKLKSILSSKVQFHTNLTMYQLQYLKQNNFLINTNMYEVVTIDVNHYAVKTVVEFNATEVIMEYNGYVSLSEEYNKEYDFRKHYNPFVLFYDKCEHLQLCVDSKLFHNKARYVRRSCTPNAEVKHRVLQDGQIRFYLVPINRIQRDSEITIAFDYNVTMCRLPTECACNQPSCQLSLSQCDKESEVEDPICLTMNAYNCTNAKLGIENVLLPITLRRPYKRRGRGSKTLNSINRQMNDSLLNSTKSAVKIVRRNKRGRPPLNRSIGIQRCDVFGRANGDNINLSDSKDVSDNESMLSRTNEIINSRLPVHLNFKSFKRISSSHWGLKANRKMAAIPKKSKPLKKLLVSSKVGRPLKLKNADLVKFEHENQNFSDPFQTAFFNESKPPPDEGLNCGSNDENDCNISVHSNKPDFIREEEGKYWLEEINNKINKQTVKEAKHIQRKGKHNKKKLNQRNSVDVVVSEPAGWNLVLMDSDVKSPVQPPAQSPVKEEVSREAITTTSSVTESREEPKRCSKKPKRGRRTQKSNISYILSYKPSNIDDLKNDLMLISASLKDDAEKEPLKQNVDQGKEVDIEIREEVTHESTDVPVRENVQQLQSVVNASNEIKSEVMLNDSFEDKTNRPKNKKRSLIQTDSGTKDQSAKASREERWVNIMWQRILKNETTDDKSKRRRSKGSAAEESIASEDNRNECSDIGSPKVGYSEISEDRDSSSNSKSSSAQKSQRKVKHTNIENENYQNINGDNNKSFDATEVKNERAVVVESYPPADDHQAPDIKETSEQCGLIVYKEQHSNPMEKFSRENSAKLFSCDTSTEGSSLVATSGNVHHPTHTKKRWLNQALREETLCDDNPTPKSDMWRGHGIKDILSPTDTVSPRGFLPPLFPSPDRADVIPLSIQKVAINPKKRLLSQFSMEDSALRASCDCNYRDTSPSKMSSTPETVNKQDQAKIKLSLSEHRKRHFADIAPADCSNVFTNFQKNITEFHNAWVGLASRCEKEANVDFDPDVSKGVLSSYEGQFNHAGGNVDVNTLGPRAVSPLDALCSLVMTSNLDPRQSKVPSTLEEVDDMVKKEVNESKAYCHSPDSTLDLKPKYSGPRSPLQGAEESNYTGRTDDLSVDCEFEGSKRASERQPSSTANCYFNLEEEFTVAKGRDRVHDHAHPLVALSARSEEEVDNVPLTLRRRVLRVRPLERRRPVSLGAHGTAPANGTEAAAALLL